MNRILKVRLWVDGLKVYATKYVSQKEIPYDSLTIGDFATRKAYKSKYGQDLFKKIPY